jgi:hypothetical protein
VRARGGFAIVDEIYQGLSYDEKPVSALALDDGRDHREQLLEVLQHDRLAPGLAGGAGLAGAGVREAGAEPVHLRADHRPARGLACFRDDALEIFEARRLEFQRRRDFLVPALRELGFARCR